MVAGCDLRLIPQAECSRLQRGMACIETRLQLPDTLRLKCSCASQLRIHHQV